MGGGAKASDEDVQRGRDREAEVVRVNGLGCEMRGKERKRKGEVAGRWIRA